MTEPSFRSVVEMFQHRVAATPDAEAMSGRRDGQWYAMSWREAERRVRAVAGGLLSLGFQKGERAAILATSRPEWVIVDLAILMAGGATSTIYTSNTSEESAYILEDSGSRFCFVENAMQEAKLRERAERARRSRPPRPDRRRALPRRTRTAGPSPSPSSSGAATPGTPPTPGGSTRWRRRSAPRTSRR